MTEAADKIDELIQANQFLVEAKDKAVKLTGQQRQKFAKQLAQLQHRNEFLTQVLKQNNIIIDN